MRTSGWRPYLFTPGLVLGLGCGLFSSGRPTQVPAEAKAIPASKGEVYARVIPGADFEARVDLWEGRSGRYLTGGRFRLNNSLSRLVRVEDLVGWDGTRFTLKDGGTLERAR